MIVIRIVAPILTISLLISSQISAADSASEVGRWCDVVGTAWKHEIAIRKTSSGAIADWVNSKPAYEQNLTIKNNVYYVEGSSFGDAYKILASGDLQILDKDGPIRVAAKGKCN